MRDLGRLLFGIGGVTFMKFGYGCEHEQYQPLTLLEHAVEAERAGFDTIWTSDHFHPWAHTNAAGGFSWVWMAAAAERTKRVEIGTGVMCPTIRYHPGVVAQAFATLRNMYPERIFVGLGSGEAINEVPLGFAWPSFKERAERLEESIKIMKLLWSGSFVSFKGKYYRLRKANLYTKPSSPPPIYVAAFGPTVAEIAGRHADGFVTGAAVIDQEHYREVLLPALERGAKSAGRDPNEIIRTIEIYIAYDEDYEKALRAARFWAGGLLPAISSQSWAVTDPREVEKNGMLVADKHVAQAWSVGTKPEDYIKQLEKYVKMGFEHINVVSSSPDPIKTIRMYGKHVLPYIRSTYAK
jgi:coenzyme F420-dependent glucose-6-phosphate dehydrogenase